MNAPAPMCMFGGQRSTRVSCSVTLHLVSSHTVSRRNLELTVSIRLASGSGSPWDLPSPPLQWCGYRHTTPHSAFYMNAGALHSGFCVCSASTLPTTPTHTTTHTCVLNTVPAVLSQALCRTVTSWTLNLSRTIIEKVPHTKPQGPDPI